MSSISVGVSCVSVRGRADGDGEAGDWGAAFGPVGVFLVVAREWGFDLADAGAGPSGRVQVVEDGAADAADEVDGVVIDDAGGLGEQVAGGFQGGGEAGPVGVGAGAGFDRGDHGVA